MLDEAMLGHAELLFLLSLKDSLQEWETHLTGIPNCLAVANH